MRWLVCVLSLSACTEPARSKPQAPDMQPLVDAYASPTRSFDDQAALDVQQLVERKVKNLVDVTGVVDRIEGALGALGAEREALDRGSFSIDASDLRERRAPGGQAGHVDAVASLVLEGEGFARITRICTGHGTPAPPIDKAANGHLELTVGYTQRGLDPVIFGGAIDCQEQLESTRLVIDGDVNLYIGNNLQIDDLPASPILFQLAGFALTIDDSEVLAGGFDFQVCRGTTSTCVPGHFEVLLGLPEEGTLVLFIDLATRRGGFRAANGQWTCDFLAGTCSDGNRTVTFPGYQL
jgi:hypothetical protein